MGHISLIVLSALPKTSNDTTASQRWVDATASLIEHQQTIMASTVEEAATAIDAAIAQCHSDAILLVHANAALPQALMSDPTAWLSNLERTKRKHRAVLVGTQGCHVVHGAQARHRIVMHATADSDTEHDDALSSDDAPYVEEADRAIFLSNEIWMASREHLSQYPFSIALRTVASSSSSQQNLKSTSLYDDLFNAYQCRLLLMGLGRFAVYAVSASSDGVAGEVSPVEPDLSAQCFPLLPLNPETFQHFEQNRQALQDHSPLSHERLQSALQYPHSPVLRHEENKIALQSGQRLVLLFDAVDSLPDLNAADSYVVLGVGTGALVNRLLQDAQRQVLVVEPQVALIVQSMMAFSWQDALKKGRLSFHIAITGTPEIDHIDVMELLRNLHKRIDESRTLQLLRSGSYGLHQGWFQYIEKALQQHVIQHQSMKSALSQIRLTYDVTVVSPQCAIFSDLADCFDELGLATRLYCTSHKMERLSPLQLQENLKALSLKSSRLTICRNRSFFETENIHNGASFERFINGQLVSWWWDRPNVASFVDMQDPYTMSTNITFAREMLDLFPGDAMWLPPAARNEFCQTELSVVDKQYELSFVGQSRIHHIREQLAIIMKGLKSWGVDVPDGIASLPTFRALYRALCDYELDFLSSMNAFVLFMPAQVYYFQYLFDMCKTGAFRVAAIEHLFANNRPVHVFGDDAWLREGIVSEHYFHGVMPLDGLSQLYQQSQLNLNLNYMQVSSTINPKVFDILACGGYVLSDDRPEVESLFPDEGLRPITFTDMEGLEAAVELALERSAIDALPLAEFVREEHSMMARAIWLADRYLAL